jgi:ribonucleoside-diphosphate reductase alpha chain
MDINVTKRDGSLQSFDLEKVHKVLEWAVEDISGVSQSEIELKSNIQLYDKIPAYDIHELLIKSASELISEHTPNYQFVAARLINYKLRKEVYGQYEPWSLARIIIENISRGVYDGGIMQSYTRDEIDQLDSYIKHDRDDLFTYAGMEQFRGKYLVQDRKEKVYYETPQMLYMMVAATLFSNYSKETRMKFVKDYYDAISQFYISLPTPIMAGVRTPTRQFSSCVLIESGDSLDSINATATSIVKYISKKAGIGIGAGSIRANGAKVGDGSVVHTGLIPFLKYFQSAVKSCSQGGVRGGAATVYLPIWHYEFEDLVVLKNNKGTEEGRVRHMDYAFQLNKLMYERLLTGGNITFFDPNDVPGLYAKNTKEHILYVKNLYQHSKYFNSY